MMKNESYFFPAGRKAPSKGKAATPPPRVTPRRRRRPTLPMTTVDLSAYAKEQ
jgi:hypothetical protein